MLTCSEKNTRASVVHTHLSVAISCTNRTIFVFKNTKVSRPGFEPSGQVFCFHTTCAGRCVVAAKRKPQQTTPGLIKTKKERKSNPLPDGFVEWEHNVIAESLSQEIESNPFEYINLVSIKALERIRSPITDKNFFHDTASSQWSGRIATVNRQDDMRV